MNKIVLYDNFSECIKRLSREVENCKFICPNPVITDYLRNIDRDINSTTISNFVQRELDSSFDNFEVMSKSNLMLQMLTVWKFGGFESSYELFMQAFELFTELRSYSLELSVIKEMASEFHEDVFKCISYFWYVVDMQGIVDEQKSYASLTECYLQKKIRHKNNFIFTGFSFMGMGQIELLNALSKDCDVYIPFPKKVYEKRALMNDWIFWPDNVEILEDGDDNQLSLDNIKKTCNLVIGHKTSIQKLLGQYFSNGDLKRSDLAIILAKEGATFEECNEIPISNMFFKSESNLFLHLVEEIILSLRRVKDPEEMIVSLKSRAQIGISTGPELKVIALIIKTIKKWVVLSDGNREINSFILKIIEAVVKLDLPRTSLIPLVNDDFGKIGSVDLFYPINSESSEKHYWIYAKRSYGAIKRGRPNRYGDKIMEFLYALGPVKNSDLDFEIIKDRLIKYLSEKNSILFIEDSLLNEDPGWNDILEDFQLKLKKRDELIQIKDLSPEYNYLAVDTNHGYFNKISKYSATSLQHYIDCPRRFFYKYIDPVVIYPKIDGKIHYHQLGTLEHHIINIYLIENSYWSSDRHRAVVEKSLDDLISRDRIILSDIDRLIAYHEVSNFSRNGISYLLKVKKLFPEAEFKFEHKFIDDNFYGSIDCLILTDRGIILIDFKRSSQSVPSVKELQQFKKIQTHFYIRHLKVAENILAFGHLDLSESNNDAHKVFFVKDPDSSVLSDLQWKTFNGFITFIEGYKSFEDNIVNKLMSEKNYLPNFADPKICTFCTVRQLCSRNEDIKR